jgi:thioredoxin
MDVATETFEQEVLARSHELPVVVDFWAAWCGPCLMLGPVLEREAEARTGELALVKVDVDQNQELALEYGIRGIPAVKAFRNGEVVSEFVGALPPAAVAQFLDELTGPSAAETLVAELRAAGELPEVVAAPAPERHARVSAALACGVERWTVKTLPGSAEAASGPPNHHRPLGQPPSAELAPGDPSPVRAPRLQPHRHCHPRPA